MEMHHPEIDAHAAGLLRAAIDEYSYPCVAYAFDKPRELSFNTMRELEAFVKNKLLSPDIERVKDGLSTILYWGHYRAGYRKYRVAEFCRTVTAQQLEEAREMLPRLHGAGLRQLKDLKLPEFSNVSFLSKLRMFLDPERYCVLDRKLAGVEPLASRLKVHSTFIPVTRQNEAQYEWWAGYCRRMARAMGSPPLRAADVERGFFQLIESGRGGQASALMALNL